ncbi:MAG: ribonuclease P protein component 1 [Nanoarchaeota archaeon]|nr:ribonuclease P protein component 1 [Nanoarchaeota archaeon]MBU4452352.1 ribonuclease P protein component 1 [Nanoarchaeota archaeon]MCG2723371.1 ribonuclease P protein component 1 [archaeon]
MPITEKNIVRHELIGLEAEIIKSTDAKKQGIKGIIIDETKKMLLLRTDTDEKLVEKAVCEFQLTLPNSKKVDVLGKLFFGRPEERIKKKFPQKWDFFSIAKN